MVKVLPVPGPPVITLKRCRLATAAARRWPGSSSRPGPLPKTRCNPSRSRLNRSHRAGFYPRANGQGQPFSYPNTDRGRAANDRPGSAAGPGPACQPREKRAARPPRALAPDRQLPACRGGVHQRAFGRQGEVQAHIAIARGAAEQGGGKLHGGVSTGLKGCHEPPKWRSRVKTNGRVRVKHNSESALRPEHE